MPRAVEEWIGKSDDSMPSEACMRRILDRQDGCCAISGRRFVPGDKIEFDHISPLWLGGENREANLQAVLREKHIAKTSAEAKVRAKLNSIRSKHLGIKKPKSRPMPGTKASGWKKPFNAPAERRDALCRRGEMMIASTNPENWDDD